MHSGICRDLASHGYIVFAPDHQDLTSSYIETPEGHGQYFCNKNSAHDLEFRQGQLKLRVGEIQALIDEMHDDDLRETLLRKKL